MLIVVKMRWLMGDLTCGLGLSGIIVCVYAHMFT